MNRHQVGTARTAATAAADYADAAEDSAEELATLLDPGRRGLVVAALTTGSAARVAGSVQLLYSSAGQHTHILS